MQRVEDHMNSEAFAAKDGTGLLGLCKQLRSRCQALVDGGGERLPYEPLSDLFSLFHASACACAQFIGFNAMRM